jgi:hypothetical protein
MRTEAANSIFRLVDNLDGYSVLSAGFFYDLLVLFVENSVRKALNLNSFKISDAPHVFEDPCNHKKIRDKENRILDIDQARDLDAQLEQQFFRDVLDNWFVTDEEQRGYPNYYWRCVRRNCVQDVGDIHADQWFWDLGVGQIPKGYRRIKFWIPLLQDDAMPSLLLAPGSHKETHRYGCVIGSDGKRRPKFDRRLVEERLIHCPVKMGQLVVFNDALLHGGYVADVTRLSLEFTVACCDEMLVVSGRKAN